MVIGQLKQILSREDTVLFIGSGLSLWSGLPNWRGFVDELADFVEKVGANAGLIRIEAENGDLLQAASYGFDKLTKPQIGEFIRLACRYGVAKPHAIHQKVVSLGPRCFITTNFDNLLEQSLQKWQPERFYAPPVSNRHLTEMATLVSARSTDFIFKPHGDAADSDSIILTREQYRQLLPQGERQAALESVKMLLASRPVVYLGFGLRDPDFVYMKDLLANTYKGGARDHYAVMADVDESAAAYWRNNYGIHLVNYSTTKLHDGKRDHGKLLELLDSLLDRNEVENDSRFDAESSEVVLSLARYAAALSRMPKLPSEVSIRVASQRKDQGRGWREEEPFDNAPVERFLDIGPQRAILIGLPGAGKTYSLRRSTARLAEDLYKDCLAEVFDPEKIVVPVFVDLKLYGGDLWKLVGDALPKGLPIKEIQKSYKIKIYLDSFNEMPREFWESGSYEQDFSKFIRAFEGFSIIIGSRTTDGLLKFEWPVYTLEEIDRMAVELEFRRLGVDFEGVFGREIGELLRRPFYFQYVVSGAISLPPKPRPKDVYQSLLANLDEAFTSKFSLPLNLGKMLSSVAYQTLNRGEEAFPTLELLRSFEDSLREVDCDTAKAPDLANWLISQSVLVPYTGGRIAFVHQSITEYLASTELARKYSVDRSVLRGRLALTRWDQALFLTLSILPPDKANEFLEDVIRVDFVLALQAVKYLESDRDAVVSRLLEEVPKRSEAQVSEWDLEQVIGEDLPVNRSHEGHLFNIVKCGGILGGAAAVRLVEITGKKFKTRLLRYIYDSRDDYNMCCNGIGPALRPFAAERDIKRIADFADRIEADFDRELGLGWESEAVEEKYHGFSGGAAEFLCDLKLSTIKSAFLSKNVRGELSAIKVDVLLEVIQKTNSSEGLEVALELLLAGTKRAAFVIHLILCFHGDEVDRSLIKIDHAKCLMRQLVSSQKPWELDALKDMCAARDDVSGFVRAHAGEVTGVMRAALLHCVDPRDLGPVFEALLSLEEMSAAQRAQVPLGLLDRINFDWSGREVLFVGLLKLRDTALAKALLGGASPPILPNLGRLEIGEVDWWLNWMVELNQEGNSGWLLQQLGGILTGFVDDTVVAQCVERFNRRNSPYRAVLRKYVIPQVAGLTTDALSEDAISSILAELGRGDSTDFFEHLLGEVATEHFVVGQLLPLLSDKRQPFSDHLRVVLKYAGSRHGRRYSV